jgi:cbb3-type cytochrome oxidase subunit 1
MHFWLFAIGLLILIGAFIVGGLAQGWALDTLKAAPDGKSSVPTAMLDVVRQISPWLSAATLAGIVMLAAHLAFAVNFFKMILCPRLRAEAAAAPVPPELMRPLSDLQLSR